MKPYISDLVANKSDPGIGQKISKWVDEQWRITHTPKSMVCVQMWQEVFAVDPQAALPITRFLVQSLASGDERLFHRMQNNAPAVVHDAFLLFSWNNQFNELVHFVGQLEEVGVTQTSLLLPVAKDAQWLTLVERLQCLWENPNRNLLPLLLQSDGPLSAKQWIWGAMRQALVVGQKEDRVVGFEDVISPTVRWRSLLIATRGFREDTPFTAQLTQDLPLSFVLQHMSTDPLCAHLRWFTNPMVNPSDRIRMTAERFGVLKRLSFLASLPGTEMNGESCSKLVNVHRAVNGSAPEEWTNMITHIQLVQETQHLGIGSRRSKL